jgi:hypothetical protein
MTATSVERPTRRSGLAGRVASAPARIIAAFGHVLPATTWRKRAGRERFDRQLWLNTERLILIAERRRAVQQHRATSGFDRQLQAITLELLRGFPMNLHFHTNCQDEARDLVERYHYSGRVPANVQFCGSLHEGGGLFGDFGRCVAACFFSIPPTRWSEDVLELSRLVRADYTVPLSHLISASCKALKRNGFDLLVSFADRTHQHHGGIYQAASWNYGGCRDRQNDGLIIDGMFWPGRSCNSKFGTRSAQKVAAILGREVIPHFDEGKHLYWKALGPRGNEKAETLKLDRLPYPKPQNAKVAAE